MAMIRVARYNMYTDKTMAWGDDRDLNLVVNVGSHVYTVYNKTAEVDHESEDALCWWWDNMARMLRRGPSNEDLERFAAHYKLEVVERGQRCRLTTSDGLWTPSGGTSATVALPASRG